MLALGTLAGHLVPLEAILALLLTIGAFRVQVALAGSGVEALASTALNALALIVLLDVAGRAVLSHVVATLASDVSRLELTLDFLLALAGVLEELGTVLALGLIGVVILAFASPGVLHFTDGAGSADGLVLAGAIPEVGLLALLAFKLAVLRRTLALAVGAVETITVGALGFFTDGGALAGGVRSLFTSAHGVNPLLDIALAGLGVLGVASFAGLAVLAELVGLNLLATATGFISITLVLAT